MPKKTPARAGITQDIFARLREVKRGEEVLGCSLSDMKDWSVVQRQKLASPSNLKDALDSAVLGCDNADIVMCARALQYVNSAGVDIGAGRQVDDDRPVMRGNLLDHRLEFALRR